MSLAKLHAYSTSADYTTRGSVDTRIPEHDLRVFPLRSLWWTGGRAVEVDGGWSIEVAEQIFLEVEELPLRILQLGYNAVILGSVHSEYVKGEAGDLAVLQRFVSLCHEHGVAVYAAPRYPFAEGEPAFLRVGDAPTLSEAVESLWEALPELDGLVWMSRLADPLVTWGPEFRDQTQYDLVQQELLVLEAALGERSLVYYPVVENARAREALGRFFSELCEDVGQHTSLAFSTLGGQPWESAHALSSVWDVLRHKKHPTITPLMPVVNMGNVRHGQGLWPHVAGATTEAMLHRMRGHAFAGAVALVAQLPREGSIAEAGLWALARAQQTGRAFEECLEEWFEVQHKNTDYQTEMSLLRSVHQLVVALDVLREVVEGYTGEPGEADRVRVHAQSLLAQLDLLKLAGTEEEPEGPITVPHQIPFFVRDAKRLLLDLLQRCHLSMPSMFSGGDTHASFWTSMAGAEGKGIAFGASSDLLPHPNRGKAGSLMERIYLDGGFS